MNRKLADSWSLWLEGKISDESSADFDPTDEEVVETLTADLKLDSLLLAMGRRFDARDEERFVAGVWSKARVAPGEDHLNAAERRGRRSRASRGAGGVAALVIAVVAISAAAMWYARRDRAVEPVADGERNRVSSQQDSTRPHEEHGSEERSSAPPDPSEATGAGPRSHAPAGRTALVVLGEIPPAAGDGLILERLARLGFGATLRRPWELDLAHDTQVDLVVVSSTVKSKDFSTDLRGAFSILPVPLVVWESWLFEGFGLADCKDNKGCGWLLSDGELSLVARGNPLVQTHPDTIQITTRPVVISSGIPKRSATLIAHLRGGARADVLFVYERGAQLTLGPAPARRVALFLTDETARYLTPAGWELFEAAINWAAETPQRSR